jgi:hypothetical protein
VTAVEPETENFPFPLVRDTYRYTANLSPVLVSGHGGTVLNAGREYEEFVAERARVLARVPDLLIRAPHLLPAEWDTLLFLMRRLTAERPADFGLRTAEGHGEAGQAGAGRFGHGERVRWENRRLGASLEFTIGDEDSLPCGPLEYIGRQVAEDLVLLDTR